MITGLAARLDAADFLFLEIVYEFGDDRFLNAKFFLTGMGDARINAGQPGRVSQKRWTRRVRISWCSVRQTEVCRTIHWFGTQLCFQLGNFFLELAEAGTHGGEF